jgi:hypothetical protein
MSKAATNASDRLRKFAALSAVLTGFTSDAVSPRVDPKNLKALYLKTADANLQPGTVDTLLSRFDALTGKSKQEIANAILATGSSTPDYASTAARAIVKMWYVGVWYPPPDPNSKVATAVVSADAYTGGLIWKCIQAHPIGFSTFNFGYWNSAPPSMQDFGVDAASDSGAANG